MRPGVAFTAVVIMLAAALCARTSVAATKIEGDYQLMLDARKSQRIFPWDWESNNNDEWTGATIRLFSTPRAGTEAFLKTEADWNSDNNSSVRPVFQYKEAHLRYTWNGRGHGVDSYLFSRQDRFWVDNYLIRVVDGNQLRNDDNGSNAQGVRVDTWGYLGMNATVIASDFSSQFNPRKPATDAAHGALDRTDDAYVVRLRREFFRDHRLRLGFTYNRKEENQLSEFIEHAQVFAGDSRYQWRGIDFSLEYAESKSPVTNITYADRLERKISFLRHSTGLHLPSRSVLVGEIRSIRFGTPALGFINVTPSYWNRGPLWEDRAGDGTRDQTGFNLNTYYLVPERAITFTNNYRRFAMRAFERREETELYNELYVEFVNGFTGKTFLRKRDFYRSDVGIRTRESHDDWFAEIQVESRLAWLRVQTKIKDLGQPFRKQLYSVENSVNLTGALKLYNRFAFANDAALLRKGIFSQLQYRPTGNMEMFLEYGPGWISDDSTPVNDGDLEGSGDQTDLIKFILKGTF